MSLPFVPASNRVSRSESASEKVARGTFQFFLFLELLDHIGIELPVLLDNTGFQAVPDYRVRSAITRRFQAIAAASRP